MRHICIAAILATTALSSSAFRAPEPGRAPAFRSWTYSRIAARSSSVNPLDALLGAGLLLALFWGSFFAGFLLAIVPLASASALKLFVVVAGLEK